MKIPVYRTQIQDYSNEWTTKTLGGFGVKRVEILYLLLFWIESFTNTINLWSLNWWLRLEPDFVSEFI